MGLINIFKYYPYSYYDHYVNIFFDLKAAQMVVDPHLSVQ